MAIGSGDWIALYGSLLPALDGLAALGLIASQDGSRIHDLRGRPVLAYAGACLIPGQLFDLGAYPGLRPGDDRVVGEAFSLLEPSFVDDLDRFEGFDSAKTAESLYLRERVELLLPEHQSAWVYIYNHAPPVDSRIVSGDWRTHLDLRTTSPPRGQRRIGSRRPTGTR